MKVCDCFARCCWDKRRSKTYKFYFASMRAEAVGGLGAPLSRHRPVISTFPVISLPANPTQRKAWVLFLPLSQMLEVAHKPEPPWGRPTHWSLVVMYQIFLTANGGWRGSKADGGYITFRVEAAIAVHWDHRTGGRGCSVVLWRTADVFPRDLVMVTLGGGCASSFDSQLISDPDGGGHKVAFFVLYCWKQELTYAKYISQLCLFNNLLFPYLFTGPSSSNSTEALDCFGDVLFSNFAHRVCCQIGGGHSAFYAPENIEFGNYLASHSWECQIATARKAFEPLLALPVVSSNKKATQRRSIHNKSRTFSNRWIANFVYFLLNSLRKSFRSLSVQLVETSCGCTLCWQRQHQSFMTSKSYYFFSLLPDRVKTTRIIFNDL